MSVTKRPVAVRLMGMDGPAVYPRDRRGGAPTSPEPVEQIRQRYQVSSLHLGRSGNAARFELALLAQTTAVQLTRTLMLNAGAGLIDILMSVVETHEPSPVH